jgi:hypothetical protein
MSRYWRLPAVVIACLSLGGLSCTTPPPKPIRIEFTTVPPRGEGPNTRGNIEGKVLGAATPEQYKIVLYALTDKWYVQPSTEDCLTDVSAEGTWSNWTHLGYRYAALLVRSSYRRPSPTLQALPPVGGDVLARAEVPAGSGR